MNLIIREIQRQMRALDHLPTGTPIEIFIGAAINTEKMVETAMKAAIVGSRDKYETTKLVRVHIKGDWGPPEWVYKVRKK